MTLFLILYLWSLAVLALLWGRCPLWQNILAGTWPVVMIVSMDGMYFEAKQLAFLHLNIS
jgi:hypothetical protein